MLGNEKKITSLFKQNFTVVKLKIILQVNVYLLIRSDILADWLVVCVCVCIVCAKYIYSGDLNKLVIALGFCAWGNELCFVCPSSK